VLLHRLPLFINGVAIWQDQCAGEMAGGRDVVEPSWDYEMVNV
jgi:hypothetical protein